MLDEVFPGGKIYDLSVVSEEDEIAAVDLIGGIDYKIVNSLMENTI